MSFKVIGSSDAITVCDCCGRTKLKFTVELVNNETGDIVHYGRDCAGAAVLGRKSLENTRNIASEAKAISLWNSTLAANGGDFKAASNVVFQKTGRSIYKCFDGNVYHRVERKKKIINIVI